MVCDRTQSLPLALRRTIAMCIQTESGCTARAGCPRNLDVLRRECCQWTLTLQAGHAQCLVSGPRDLLVHVRAQLGLLRGGHLGRQRRVSDGHEQQLQRMA